jgi:hypothetical protein
MADEKSPRFGEPPVVEIPQADYARLIGARAEMEYWASAGNTVARGWVVSGGSPQGRETYSPAEIKKMLECSDRTVLRLANSAGIDRSGSKRGDKYTRQQLQQILREAIASSDEHIASKAKAVLNDPDSFPTSRQ